MSLSKHNRPIECTTSEQLFTDEVGGIRSVRFDDFYFNPGCGAEETRHVFIDGNQLELRWQKLCNKSSHDKNYFVIAETGFGTGLNFLATVELWINTFKQQADQGPPTLYYYSTERFPLTAAAMQKAWQAYNPLPDLSQRLLTKYPDPIGSDYLLDFSDSGCPIKLVLLFGDSAEALDRLEHYPPAQQHSLKVDTWFLDGFAPSKNSAMWNAELFKQIQRHSKTGTTAATFTVARAVRDLLTDAGFNIEKKPGFGNKREMLTARCHLEPAPEQTVSPAKTRSQNFSPCYYRYSEQHFIDQVITRKEPKTALVIGAGIAGCCTAWQLANSGWQVTVLEGNAEAAREASGNSAAVLYARTANQRSTLADFHEASFHFAVNFYRSLSDTSLSQGLNGMLKCNTLLNASWLADNPECSSRHNVDVQQASKLAGVKLSEGGIYYPHAGYLLPKELCEHLLESDNIQLLTNTFAESLKRREKDWQVFIKDGRYLQADVVVITCGDSSCQFEQTAWLPIKALRGQTSELPATASTGPLKIALCDKGYIVPAQNGLHNIGATFTLNSQSPEASLDEHRQNIDNAHTLLFHDNSTNRIIDEKELQALAGKVGFRATSPDYLPMVGPVADRNAYNACFSALSNNAKHAPTSLAAMIPGLYVNTALGSHGFTTAPLAAELLAAQINQMPIPFGDKLRQAISPARFLLRQIIRKNKN